MSIRKTRSNQTKDWDKQCVSKQRATVQELKVEDVAMGSHRDAATRLGLYVIFSLFFSAEWPDKRADVARDKIETIVFWADSFDDRFVRRPPNNDAPVFTNQEWAVNSLFSRKTARNSWT
jgi:hypothetical protein